MEDKHEIAVWAGVVAFFASLLTIGVFDVFQPDQWIEYLGALFVALITAAFVYAKERYNEAVKAKEGTQ